MTPVTVPTVQVWPLLEVTVYPVITAPPVTVGAVQDTTDWALALDVPATDVVQSDLYGELALYDVGYATRSNFFAVIDPVVVDNNSWVYADQANIPDGVARDGNGVIDDIYQFPRAYFTSTRAVLYTSRNDVVFGPAAPESVLTTNTKAAT